MLKHLDNVDVCESEPFWARHSNVGPSIIALLVDSLADINPASCGAVSDDWILNVIHRCHLVERLIAAIEYLTQVLAPATWIHCAVLLPQGPKPNRE